MNHGITLNPSTVRLLHAYLGTRLDGGWYSLTGAGQDTLNLLVLALESNPIVTIFSPEKYPDKQGNSNDK